jgi:sigma-B regulation protein RsbU (phosphoserine phosphatase)
MDWTLLQSHSLLKALPEGSLERLIPKCRLDSVTQGEVILTPGKENDTLYFLLLGQLQVHLDSLESGNSFPIVPGEIVGEMSIIENRPVAAWVVAQQPSTLLAMPQQVFWEEFVRIPQAVRTLLQLLIRRVRKTDSVLLGELERKVRYEHLQRELESAGKIQANLLPPVQPLFPRHPQVETYALIKPAREVGGDFFDAFEVDDHTVCIAIGDVSGKGMPAALFMVRVITLLRMCLLREPPPTAVLPALNRLLCEANNEFMFVSLAVALLDVHSGKLSYHNGGHNPPFLATGGQPFRSWQPPVSLVLGINSCNEFPVAELQMHPGDTLLLYTDGITEAQNARREVFTSERAVEALAHPGPSGDLLSIVENLAQAAAMFTGDAPQSDDITALALRYRGTPA